jgi:hypothetical protein
MSVLGLYLYAAMLFWVPLEKHRYHEAEAVTVSRYLQIAQDIADGVEDPSEPSLYGDDETHVKAGLQLAAIARYESGGFDPDVQFCKRFGDHNKSRGLFQSHESEESVCYSLRNAVHIALRQLRASLAACRAEPVKWRLSAYASGSCGAGHLESERRVRLAADYWREHPYVPVTMTHAEVNNP